MLGDVLLFLGVVVGVGLTMAVLAVMMFKGE